MAINGIRNVSKTLRTTKGSISKSSVTQSAYPSSDKVFNDTYAQAGLQPLGIGNTTKKEEGSQEQVSTSTSYQGEQGPTSVANNQKKLSLKKTGDKIVKSLALKTRVSSVNYSIFAWGGSIWFFVQLPFALMLLITLGLASAIESVADANIITRAVAGAVNLVTSAAASLVGIEGNLSDLAESYMLILYVIIIAIGFMSLFTAFLQYSLALLNPLAGEHAGLKKGVFLVCLFGYSAPLLNMFPWILLWMAVVWKYPK